MTDVNGHHLGLAGMRDRVESLGGHFEIESGPETGTRVTAWLPQLAEDSDHA
jgi:signal transduction histidine kinase